jgi:methionine-rich copper-binding protein CopC
MSIRTRVALVALAMPLVPAIWAVASVSAHATIGSVAWNSDFTKVIATSRGDDIRNAAGTYGLQVFDPSGRDITAGATTITGPKTMEVAVSRPTSQGQYRVAWKTRSAEPDMHDASGNLSLQLSAVPGAPAAPAATTDPAAPSGATAPTAAGPVSPPSTGDGGLLDEQTSGTAAIALVASVVFGAAVAIRRIA